MLRLACLFAALAVALAASGCSTVGLALTAAGVATDTSVTWEVVKHVHGKLTEDDPTPCVLLNSVQRAVNPRCEFVPGSIVASEIAGSGLQACPLAVAVRDERLWRAVPELVQKGARPESCTVSPLLELAQADDCPHFAAAPPEVVGALRELALDDRRAVRHDVFRMLGCPNARAAGLDRVLTLWLDRGDLEPGTLSFSPLSALPPDLLVTRLARELEVAGHTPAEALGGYDGRRTSGFEEALRTSHWAALEWWLYRLPQLANQAPPTGGGAMAWLPLQRVLLPGYLRHPESQRDMVAFLLARGADPRRKLPFDTGKTVASYAAALKSPMAELLDPPPPDAPAPPRLARSEIATTGPHEVGKAPSAPKRR